MKTPRTSWLKAAVTVFVYAVIGVIFLSEYPGVTALFWGLSALRIYLLVKEVRRNASLPDLGSLDSSKDPK